MRRATKTTAVWLGVLAGIAGFEHGYFAYRQGSNPIPGLVFPSWGPPCVPEEIWHSCEPAMSIVPNFVLTGVLAMLLSLTLLVWTVWFVGRRYGGWVQMTLSVLLPLFGGGFFPPIIGFVGGLARDKSQPAAAGANPVGDAHVTRFAARLWPWSLGVFVVWTSGAVSRRSLLQRVLAAHHVPQPGGHPCELRCRWLCTPPTRTTPRYDVPQSGRSRMPGSGKALDGTSTYFLFDQKSYLEDWATLFRLLVDGKIDPVIAARIPILEAARANELLESGGVTGNVVLVSPSGSP